VSPRHGHKRLTAAPSNEVTDPGGALGSLWSNIGRGAAGTFALNVAALILGIVVALVLSRQLGAAGYGAYAFALSWASLLSVPALLGLTPVLVRNVAAYKAQERWAELRGIVRRANQVVLGMSIALPVGAAIVGVVFTDPSGELAEPFLVGLTLVPLLALSALRFSTLQALGHVVLGRLPETIIAPASFLGLVALAVAIPEFELSATSAVALQAAATLLAFAVGLVLVRRLLPDRANTTRAAYETRAWARSAAPLLLVSGLAAVNLQAGIVALGFATDPGEVGVYGVAGRIATLTGFISIAVTYALMPEIARLHAVGSRKRLGALLPRSARIVMLLSLPLACVFLVVPGIFLGLFGEAFEGGETILRILVLGELVKLALGSGSATLAMMGFEDQVLKGAAAGAVSNVVLLVPLVPAFGGEGAAAATALSGLVASGVYAYLAWTRARLYVAALSFPRFAR
jgi:O-antigen/teichoic acid export membrane protein